MAAVIDNQLAQEPCDECGQRSWSFWRSARWSRIIRRNLSKCHENDFSIEEIVVYSDGGSTKYYQVPSAGVLANERGASTNGYGISISRLIRA